MKPTAPRAAGPAGPARSGGARGRAAGPLILQGPRGGRRWRARAVQPPEKGQGQAAAAPKASTRPLDLAGAVSAPPFTLQQLLMLKAVGEIGSVSAAAEALYMSQPALTLALQKLERQLEAPLVNRSQGRGYISMTEAGQLLLHYAGRFSSLSNEALQALSDLKELEVGTLTLGASQTTGTYLLPRIVGKFQQKYPKIGVQLIVDSTRHVCYGVATGEIDIAVVGGTIPDDLSASLQSTTYCEDATALILPPKHPLARGPAIEKQELYGLDFVSLNETSTVQSFQNEQLELSGIDTSQMRVQMEFNSIEAIKNAVQYGLGAAFVSETAIEKELDLGLLQKVTIRGLNITRNISVVTNPQKYFSNAAESFIREMLTAADWYSIHDAKVDQQSSFYTVQGPTNYS